MFLRNKSTIGLLVFLLMVNLTNAKAAESYASLKFQYALGECERGLDANLPTTKSSLRILKLSLKRYERNRDVALRKDMTLPKSQDLMSTEGRLNDKTFAEAFQICEDTLASTIENAERHVAKLLEKRKARMSRNQVKVEALREKINAAKSQVDVAINQSCVRIIQQATNIDPHRLLIKFKKAKQNALNAYPNIAKQFHEIILKDADTGEEQKLIKTVQGWFTHCDALFDEALGQGPKLVDDTLGETDDLATDEEQIAIKAIVGETKVIEIDDKNQDIAENAEDEADLSMEEDEDTEDFDAQMEAEYQAYLKKVSGDRRQILEKEGRIADFSNNEDNELDKANIWQYEQAEGESCTTYTFKGDRLENIEEINEECPPFN